MHATVTPARRTALGIVELLISLTIAAMILASVAVAFHASANTIDENQKIATITQAARIILNRMIAECRQADDVDFPGATPVQDTGDPTLFNVTTTHLGIAPPLLAGQPTDLEYQFLDGTLWYRQTLGGTLNSYAILAPEDGVTISRFRILATKVDANNDGDCADVEDYTQDITAEMTLRIDGNVFLVTASTNPRRAMDW